jgi:hypothetical protein
MNDRATDAGVVATGRTHVLKCWPLSYARIASGEKRVEILLDDRGYHAGDELHLDEWDPALQRYTGRACVVRVTSVGYPAWFGLFNVLEVGYVAMSIELVAVLR